ncbi:MAG: hypothetical protein COA84_00275 [Robiginitomaculum sp.]|nr:MAG: hypothetical protein COA84_00275 [Robiginitomaculum sp.]
MIRSVLKMLAGMAVLLTAPCAFAGNPFEITGVRIDAYGRNVTKAREQAIRVGTLDATYLLLDRLTLPSDRLALDPPLVITEDIAEQLVAGIGIAKEKRSRSRYLGELSVTFDAALVRAFLRVQGLPFVESQATPVLIVALWKDDEGKPVLHTDNPLARVLKRPAFQNHLVPLRLATEGMNATDEDELSLLAWRLAQLDTGLLSTMATNVGVREVIVASALQDGPAHVRMDVRRVVVGDMGIEAVVDMGRFEGEAEYNTPRSDKLSRALFLAADNLAQTLDTSWKHKAIVRGKERQSVRLTALYNGLDEWQRLRDALGGVALVEEARLDALSYDGALLTLRYIGSEEQLARRLAQKGIALGNEDIGLVARIQ